VKIEAAQRQLVSWALAVAFAAAVLLPSAGQGETPAAAPGTGTETPVVVFAAASLKTALDAVAAAWKLNTGKTASMLTRPPEPLQNRLSKAPPPISLSPPI
jgi:molybdate transport system substrate-binding protein